MTDLTERALQIALENGETASKAIRERDETQKKLDHAIFALESVKHALTQSYALHGYSLDSLYAKVCAALERVK
jgi:hypothetical protein